MAKRLTNNIITGNDTRLRMCFYYSPYFGQNIWRRGSSLTGERTKKDPAFKGFRESSSRLKEASPIAASLYKLVPERVKQYSLYRTLTGEAIKMLKEGMEADVISETLKKKYIGPLLDAPKKKSENKNTKEPVTRDRVKGMTDFSLYSPIAPGVRKISRTRRSHLLQKITANHSAVEYLTFTDSDLLLQTNRKISEFIEQAKPKLRTKTTSGLIYLGRLPECKKLKIWMRPIDFLS